MTTDTLHPVEKESVRWEKVFLTGLAILLLTLFCLQLIRINGQIAPLWLPTALLTVVIFRLRGRTLFYSVLLGVSSIVVGNATILGLSAGSFIYAFLNLTQATIAGLLMRLLLDRQAPLSSLSAWCKLVVSAGLFAPLLVGFIAILVLKLTGESAGHFYITWVLSETIGNMALAPVALLWRNNYLKQLNQNTLFETLITLSMTLLLCYVALHFLPSPFTFVVVILFWSAVRLPRFEAFVVFFANLLVMSLQLAVNEHPAKLTTSSLLLTAPWLPFLLALIPCHMMTLVMYSFREEKKHISESETRFRHAMEFSTIGMALVSPTGQWMQVNKALCRLLGYNAETLRAMTFQQITHPDDLHADLRQLQALLQDEIENYTLEKRYLHRDGHIVWVLLAVSLVRDNEGHPLYLIAQIKDITELKQSEQVNQRLMERITLANEAGGIGVWEWNVLTGEMNWDKRMFEIYELPADAVPNYAITLARVIPEDLDMAEAAIQNALLHQQPLNVEYRIHSSQGVRYLRAQANRVLNQDGKVARMLGIVQDVSQLRRLNEALFQEKERMQITLDSIGEAVISTNEQMQVTFMNPVAEKMSGWLQADAQGKDLSMILHITHGRGGPVMDNLLLCDLPEGKSTPDFEEELVLHSQTGEQFDIHYSITPLKTLDGHHIGTVMIVNDVSASREMMKRLSYSASHDMLTRLPNRMNFELQLKRLLLSAVEFRQQHVLAFIDLDRFKAVNDTAGHAAGDALLRELSALMQHPLRGTDFLARLGGDEFGVLLPDCPLDKALDVIQHIVTAVNEYRFVWEGRVHRVGASAGVTLITQDNCIAAEVMSQADLACYNAKHSGRGQLSVFEKSLLAGLKPKMSREDNERTLRHQPLTLNVWPVTPPNIPQSTSLWLTELQLTTPAGHLIDEQTFRAGLQECALFVELDRKLITEFFQHHAQEVAHKGLLIALPLSSAGLRDRELMSLLVVQLIQSALSPTRLTFCVTLDTLLDENPLIHAHVQQLKTLGCRILVKDFGRNLDAFTQLRSEECDYLLLSPDLVANVHCNLMDEMMVSIIHGHAQRMNISTLTGPIELPVALNTLSNIGIEGVWGPAVAPQQTLSSLLSHSYFAIK
ncbi:diguanylate cyclase [Enterobacterales bacterium CwR94]|nr:diguanylate cyclase [Enterobacterales bacterium CwR94]